VSAVESKPATTGRFKTSQFQFKKFIMRMLRCPGCDIFLYAVW
jgi:hypothetical protein